MKEIKSSIDFEPIIGEKYKINEIEVKAEYTEKSYDCNNCILAISNNICYKIKCSPKFRSDNRSIVLKIIHNQ